MSLSDIFSDKVSSRVVAYAFAAAAVLGLEGCATSSSTFKNVVPTATRAGTLPIRQGMANELSHATKCALGVVAAGCGQNNNATTDQLGTPRRADPRLGY